MTISARRRMIRWRNHWPEVVGWAVALALAGPIGWHLAGLLIESWKYGVGP